MRDAEVTAVCRGVDLEYSVSVGSEIFGEVFNITSVTADVNLYVLERFECDLIGLRFVESFRISLVESGVCSKPVAFDSVF
jgi:hypothetical protein